MSTSEKIIFTIGHSTKPFNEFIGLLNGFNIRLLADVRSFPGSRRFPQYNKESLMQTLPQSGIEYQHFPVLGGRRKAQRDSKNTVWKNEAFRGYADYMETTDFENGIFRLEKIALQKLTAYMCSEALWWRCHRSLISDYLKLKGWTVLHIMAINKAVEHPYTAAANIADGKLNYHAEGKRLF